MVAGDVAAAAAAGLATGVVSLTGAALAARGIAMRARPAKTMMSLILATVMVLLSWELCAGFPEPTCGSKKKGQAS